MDEAAVRPQTVRRKQQAGHTVQTERDHEGETQKHHRQIVKSRISFEELTQIVVGSLLLVTTG